MTSRRLRVGGAVLAALLAGATARTRADDEPHDEPAPTTTTTLPPDPPRLALETELGRVMEFTGTLEAGYRWISGEDQGRFEEDWNLDDGFRVFRFELEGESVDPEASLQSLSLRATGLGDPHRHYELEARGREGFLARGYRDQIDFVHQGSVDSRPYDTSRQTTGALLRLPVMKGLRVTLSTDHLQREGDATLSHMIRGERPLFVAAPIRTSRRNVSVGVDGASGVFRFGVRHTLSNGDDDSLRLLDRPDTPVDDLGTYRVDSALRRGATTAHAGVSLFRGIVDVQVLAGYAAARNDADILGSEQVVELGPDQMPNTGDELAFSVETRGRSDTRWRSRTLRGDVTLRPADSVDVVLRSERREDDERASLDYSRREQTPPFSDPSGPFFTLHQRYGSSADQDRDGGEVRWRATDDLRFRAGVEDIRESIFAGGDRRKASSPKTTVLLGGVDAKVTERFDGSLLVRHIESGGTVSRLGTDTGDSITFRGRGRFDDGWTLSSHVKWKAREENNSDSRVRNDAYGLVLGRTCDAGWFSFSAFRHRYRVHSDTRFVIDLAIDPTKRLRRVTYDETVDTLSFDFSRKLSGPLRLFGAARWTHAAGDVPALGREVSLGLGWALSKSLEVRVEGRTLAWTDDLHARDSYRSEILTLSFALQF